MSLGKKLWWLLPAILCVGIGGALLVGKYSGWFDHIARFYVVAGDKALEERAYGRAIQQYDFALAFRELDGKSAHQASLGKARVYLLKNRYSDAESQLLETIRLWPSEVDSRNELGSLYLQHNELAMSREQFERAIEKDNKNSEALVGLSRVLIAQNASSVEIKNSLLRAEQDPDNTAAPYYLGLLSLKYGTDISKGKEILTGLAARQGTDLYAVKSRLVLGVLNNIDTSGESDGAKAYQAVVRAWMFADVEEWSLALAEARQAIDLLPEYRDAYLVGAYVQMQRDAYGLAKDLARQAVSIDPLSGFGTYLLGKASFELDELSDAQESLERAIALGYRDTDAYRTLAHIAKKRSDNAGAKRWYDELWAVRQPISLSLAQEIIFFYIQELNLPNEAAQRADQLIAGASPTARAYALKAHALNSAGDARGAEDFVARAQVIDERDALAEYVLGVIAHDKKQEAVAEERFDRALEYDVNGDLSGLAI